MKTEQDVKEFLQFLKEEDPAGHKHEDFPELVAAAKRLRALQTEKKKK